MDSLRATNLSSVLSDTTTTTSNNNNNSNNSNNGKKPAPAAIKLDKDNVSRLVKSFGELSKHEKILFLINIREFTRGETAKIGEHVCNGAASDSPQQQSATSCTSGSTTTSTPQSLRLSRTSNWLQKTFIQDTQVALPKEEVYSLYKHEFLRQNEKPISTADFGKLMRQVFPDVKARRLGQRGQSKYCYANIRKRSEVEKPALPTPLPQNELISWAKNKFNIDFSEVGQVVAFLKSDNNLAGGSLNGRKRRASCGGNLLKQRSSSSSSKHAAPAIRSASVSVLEVDNKDDPLMVLHDTESLELGSYFENSDDPGTSTTTTNWPQLRSLLTEETFSSSSQFSKKKRHSSSVQFEFIKPELHVQSLHRSQSVPVTEMTSFTRATLDELQSTSSSSIFDELSSSVQGSSNPLFSSAAASIINGANVLVHVQSNNSSCSSSSSGGGGGGSGAPSAANGLFESIDMGGGASQVVDEDSLLLGRESGDNGGGGNSGSSSVVGNDVFFDSVFDLMMSDCQN